MGASSVVPSLDERGWKIGECGGSQGTAGGAALACERQMPFAQAEIAGATRLTMTVFSRTAGAARTRWNDVPMFWRVQIVGWGLFAIVDLVNLRLLYHEFPTAFRRTALIVVCLVLISTGMRQVY